MTDFKQGSYVSEFSLLSLKYQIELVYDGIFFPIGSGDRMVYGENPGYSLLTQYAPMFVFELGLYPLQFIHACGIERIFLASRLTYKSQRLGGFFLISHKAIYLDVSYIRYSKEYAVFALHHELFHAMNYFALGNFVQDDEWECLNVPGFRYGLRDNITTPDKDPSSITKTMLGFLNSQSTLSIAEDKAILFAHLVSNYCQLSYIAKADHVLQSKINRLKGELEKVCTEIDRNFWHEIRLVRS